MTPNTVAMVLDASGVRYERDLHGFRVGNLRLQRGSGIAGMGGDWFIRSVCGPSIRTRSVTTQKALRALICDYFPRWQVRDQRGAFGNKRAEIVLVPRRINPDGSERLAQGKDPKS